MINNIGPLNLKKDISDELGLSQSRVKEKDIYSEIFDSMK